jgi:chitodextrinase
LYKVVVTGPGTFTTTGEFVVVTTTVVESEVTVVGVVMVTIVVDVWVRVLVTVFVDTGGGSAGKPMEASEGLP